MKRLLLSAFCALAVVVLPNIAEAACVLQSISIGQTINGSLSNTDCLDTESDNRQYYGDYYEFSGTAGQQIYVSLSSTAIDAFVFLVNPDGSYVADDDGGGGTNARLPAGSGYITLPATGKYTIEASSNLVLQTGAYTLTLLTNSAPPPVNEDPVLKQDVTAIMDDILGLIGGETGSGITDQLQLILDQVINAGSDSTCPKVTSIPPLDNLEEAPPNLQLTISYGTGCIAKDGKNMSGSVTISFTNLQINDKTISASNFAVVFNNVKVNGATYANGSISGDLNLTLSTDSSDNLNIDSGHANIMATNFMLSNGNVINGTITFTASSSTTMLVSATLTTTKGNISLNLSLAKQANGSYLVNTTAPGQGKDFAIEIKGLVLDTKSCDSNYPIGGHITFARGGQTATATFDASCSGKYAYSATGTVVTQNYSDSWWNPSESGWGITITDHGTNIFVQWYTYSTTGHNQKYVISGGTFTNGKCLFSGTIQHVSGPSWTLSTFDPNQVLRTTVGSGTIDFCPAGLAAGTIVFNYTVNGTPGSKQLVRLTFGNDVPHWGGTANTGGPDFTDLYWNPAESGWGVSVTQHGNNIFFRIFVYDTDNTPLLFVVPGVTFNSATSFTGALQLTTGPWWGSNPFDPNQVKRTTAGSATLTFSDANNGVLSYTVNGVTKTKSITRILF